MRMVHQDESENGRYRIECEKHVLNGVPTFYVGRVRDMKLGGEVVCEQMYHRDADLMCDLWANVAALLARDDSALVGAYVIGASEY